MAVSLADIEKALTAGIDAERIETHAAVILLIGDRALKLKKRVAYSFLDFTTLEARKAALANELKLNRRTAPQLYRRLLPVTCEAGQVTLDGQGEVVDWALEMQRFDQAARLDRVATTLGLDDRMMAGLGRTVALFHAGLEPLLDKGGLAAHREIARGNEVDLLRSVPSILGAKQVGALVARTAAELARLGDLLEARRQAGMVRLCHGDLHLENIVLLDGKPVLFDCIEFDDAFAQIDLLYDIAFLVMDLLDRSYPRAAWQVLQGYLEQSEDDAGQAALPFFLTTRATIRAKIEAFGGHREKARRYLTLASSMLEPAQPAMLAVGGLSGTGKSTLAMQLAPGLGPAPGAVLLRSDVIRKRLMGAPLEARLPASAYSPRVTDKVFAIMAQRARTLIEAGRAVVVDSVFALPDQRDRMAGIAAQLSVPFCGIWLEAPQQVLEQRVAARRHDVSDANVEVVRRQSGYDTGSIAWHRLDARGKLEEVTGHAEALLRRELGGAC